MRVTATVTALQQLAASVRSGFDIPVIGITGSNGKTIVKEWLYQLLKDRFSIVRSPGSYNSQIGVPLSVWKMNDQHTLGIFEAGISEPGEMESLERIIRPTVGIFTNIGEAHNQGFLNSRQKINEKLQLFRHAEVLIYCKDYYELNEAIQLFSQTVRKSSDKPLQLISWSQKTEAALQILSIRKEQGRTEIEGLFQDRKVSVQIPFVDAASVENAINCWCYMLYAAIPDEEIADGMALLKPIAMRLEIRQGDNNTIVINDAYNSDLTSLQIALDTLQQQNMTAQTVILSDMLQTGRAEVALYSELSEILQKRGIRRFIGIGNALTHYSHLFDANKDLQKYFFRDTADFLRHFKDFVFENEAVLLKGSRSFAFEKISLLLEQRIHQTVMTVNLSAMVQNLQVFRRRLKPGTRTMVMVKASSYGSGGHEVARVLEQSGVDYLTVAYADEGVALRKAGIELPIMVMSPSIDAFDRMILWRLEPELFNMRSLTHFVAVAENIGVKDYPVHIKLDTGMHRLGFMESDLDELTAYLDKCSCLRIASVFSHLAAADDQAHRAFTQQQAGLFQRMCGKLSDALGYRPLMHLCNTAGIVQYPEYHFDMVRLGLGLYGIDSSGSLNNQLRQISALKTVIAQIKEVDAGETIGYSRKGKVDRHKRIATICIGYADGYPRALSRGNAYVMISNKPAPLIGIIAMDMCMVDITDIDQVQEGDEVIIFGDALPIQQLADWAGTIPYEIMTGISQRVKRVYINETQ
ncbi:bifunctional UDP-N-acetylmuramoyl-tripeptide:D-alanyl-D-alanine ligase/alanine racemase [Rurimicrobium arvi]|uniref:Alanine racemase n=1 Tax=Rurimicrobium arvi TaxID=2049916 RepID=A0ABP8MMH3_9BACT